MSEIKHTEIPPLGIDLRIIQVFDEDLTAGSFLSEDGDGGFAGGVYRMAREIDALRGQSEADKARIASSSAAMRQIKSMVCGERNPNWSDNMATTHTRARIADIIDREV